MLSILVLSQGLLKLCISYLHAALMALVRGQYYSDTLFYGDSLQLFKQQGQMIKCREFLSEGMAPPSSGIVILFEVCISEIWQPGRTILLSDPYNGQFIDRHWRLKIFLVAPSITFLSHKPYCKLSSSNILLIWSRVYWMLTKINNSIWLNKIGSQSNFCHRIEADTLSDLQSQSAGCRDICVWRGRWRWGR